MQAAANDSGGGISASVGSGDVDDGEYDGGGSSGGDGGSGGGGDGWDGVGGSGECRVNYGDSGGRDGDGESRAASDSTARKDDEVGVENLQTTITEIQTRVTASNHTAAGREVCSH